MAIPVAASIWLWVVTVIPPLVVKLLAALGIGFLTYEGADLAIGAVGDYVESQLSGLPAYALSLVGMLQMDTAISMILAAYSARFAVQAVSGALTKVSWGNAGNSVGV
jgi:hypothetical protein